MRSRLAKLVIAVAVVAMAVPAFAAVESVKVGGDIDVKGVYRKSFGFADVPSQNYTYIGTRIYVTADLTDNVAVMVRLINERDFGNDYLREVEGSLAVDLAYVKLSDLMTPGMDLTVGRQEIQLGKGLVVGSRYRAVDYIGADVGTAALDLGQQKAFDAVKVDYAFPMTDFSMTAFKAKILDNTLPVLGAVAADLDLWGLAVKYDNEMFCLEPYFVYVQLNETTGLALPDFDLMTLGARAGFSPMENLDLEVELAKQFGDANLLLGADSFSGWAAVLGGGYTFDGEMEPTLTAGYSFFSGQDSATDINGWVPVFPGNIASRVGKIAYPVLFPAGEGWSAVGIGTDTGLQVFNLGFGLQPVEKVALGFDWFNLRARETGAGVSNALGNELDFCMKYMYTEDVTFGVDLGFLLAGENIEDNLGAGVENPWQLVASMNVAF